MTKTAFKVLIFAYSHDSLDNFLLSIEDVYRDLQVFKNTKYYDYIYDIVKFFQYEKNNFLNKQRP